MDAGLKAPPQLPNQQRKREDTTYPSFGDAVGSGGTECRVDGVISPCSMAMQLVNSGAGAQCPFNDCGVHSLTVQAIGADGRMLDSSTVLRAPGQLGWDGSLDGTYRPSEIPHAGVPSITVGWRIYSRVSGDDIFSRYTQIASLNGVPPDPQDSSQKPYIGGLSGIEFQDRAIINVKIRMAVNRDAWNEYYDCVYNSPGGMEYREELKDVKMFEPPFLGLGLTSLNAGRHVMHRLPLNAVAVAAEREFIMGLPIELLLDNARYTGEIRLLRKKFLDPAMKDCAQKVKQKYGFMPRGPELGGRYN